MEHVRFCMLCGMGKLMSLGGFAGTRFLGKCLGGLIWHFIPERRRLAAENIASHLDLSAAEAKAVAHASFLNTGQSFLELLLTQRFGFDFPRLAVEPPELLEKLRSCQRPVVAATAHFGAWELLAPLLGQLYQDRPRLVVVRRYDDNAAQAFIERQRQATGAKMIGHRLAAMTVLRALHKNGIAAFLVDHNTKPEEALFIPFLKEKAAVNAGPALLAVRARALVWPVVLSRRGKDYVFRLQPPLDTAELEGSIDDKIRQTAVFYTRAIENFVKSEPEQWFWMHNRWKTRPQLDASTAASAANAKKTPGTTGGSA